MTGLKKYWQHHASHLCRLIADAMKMADKEDRMNIEPLLPHSDVILYLGQYEKVSVPVGSSVPIDAATNQYAREIVGKYQRVISKDHDCNYEKVIPSVTLHMNITETAGEYLYSGGPNGLGRIFVLVYNETTYHSTGIKNI